MKLFQTSIIILFFIITGKFDTNAQVTRLGKNVLQLSEYIASDYFKNLKSNDLSKVDTIYLRALKLTNGNYSEAMLALTFTVIPYNVVPIVLPVVKIKFGIPLVSANDSVFSMKNAHLPKNLMIDSPQNSFGDKDKLAHFFGNAFLEYNTRFFDFIKFLGIFVEDFEHGFVPGSVVDPRDLEANYIGMTFGKAVKKNKKLLPSQIFLSYSILKTSAYEFNFSYR